MKYFSQQLETIYSVAVKGVVFAGFGIMARNEFIGQHADTTRLLYAMNMLSGMAGMFVLMPAAILSSLFNYQAQYLNLMFKAGLLSLFMTTNHAAAYCVAPALDGKMKVSDSPLAALGLVAYACAGLFFAKRLLQAEAGPATTQAHKEERFQIVVRQ